MVDKISRARKKELEQPDPFLESLHKGVAYAKKHQKKLIAVSIVILASVSIVSGIIYSIKSSETKASSKLTQALMEYASEENPVIAFNSVKDDFSSILKEYPDTVAGRIARVRFAEICYKGKDYDQAYENYKASLSLFKGDPVMENLLYAALGHTCQAKNAFDEASDYYNRIINGKSDFLKAEAHYNLGLIFENLGKIDESRQHFQTIVSSYENSIFFAIAQNKIQFQDIGLKNPES